MRYAPAHTAPPSDSRAPSPDAHPGARRAPRRGALRRGAALLVLLGLGGLFLAACAEEKRTIDLVPVPMPEGGSIYTVALIDQPDRLDVIAPTHAGLFVHRNDTGPWQRVLPRSSAALLDTTIRPDDADQSLSPGSGALNFRPSELFTAHDGRLWVAPGASDIGARELLVSEDLGQIWKWVALPTLPAAPDHPDEALERPERARDNSETPAAPTPEAQARTGKLPATPAEDFEVAGTDRPARPAPRPPSAGESDPERAHAEDARPLSAHRLTPNPAHLRFMNNADQGLYLMGSLHLWRLDLSADDSLGESPREANIWVPISLAGTGLDAGTSRTQLPQVLRHYLPASDDRPYELATVLRERLYVYRRDAGKAEFKQVSALDGADYQLVSVPGSAHVLLLTSEGLFKSEDAGDSWARLNWYALSQDEANGVAVQVLAATAEQPTVLLVALETGAIYRSEDLGEKFSEVRPPDVDRRGVSDFAYSARRDRVWAATNGAGVLRSLDRGQTWHPINDKLRANRAFDIGADDSDGFLLGSDAGLYRLSGPPSKGRWQMLQHRATTSIYVEKQSGAILNGTTTGAIVRLEPDGKSTASQAAPLVRSDAIAYQAFRFRGMELGARAIVEIDARPDNSKVYAWSARRGPMISLDSGISWTPMELNPAFQSALEGSYISNFTTEFGDRMYLLTHGLSESAPTQLWRSYNNGDTWHAVSSFQRGKRRSDVFIKRSPDYPAETIFAAHQNRFARSVDGGNSWRNFMGPWTDGQILLYELRGDTHLLVVKSYQTFYLVQVSETDQDRPLIRTSKFKWPPSYRTTRTHLRKLAVQSGFVFLGTDRGLVVGALPDGRQRLPNGLAILVTLLSVFTLTLLGYSILRASV